QRQLQAGVPQEEGNASFLEQFGSKNPVQFGLIRLFDVALISPKWASWPILILWAAHFVKQKNDSPPKFSVFPFIY
ncbi:MAG: hypothetical protein PH343_05205, partial [Nitrospira sp.]|nr:hypothetical protein [Nitrospira sp.]